MTTNSRIKLLVFGPALFWWLPCLFLAIETHIWLFLLWPFLGFYPGTRSDADHSYSVISMVIFGCLSFVGYSTLAFYALRKKSQALAITCATLISLSSLFVIVGMIWFLLQEQR